MKYVDCNTYYEPINQRFRIDGEVIEFPKTFTYYRKVPSVFSKYVNSAIEPVSITINRFEYGPMYVFGKEDDLIFHEDIRDVTPHYDHVDISETFHTYTLKEVRWWLRMSKEFFSEGDYKE